MAVALHTYLLDNKDRIFARITTYAPTEDDAVAIVDDIDFAAEDEISVLEESTVPPLAEEMRAIEQEQLGEEDDDAEPEEEGDGERKRWKRRNESGANHTRNSGSVRDCRGDPDRFVFRARGEEYRKMKLRGPYRMPKRPSAGRRRRLSGLGLTSSTTAAIAALVQQIAAQYGLNPGLALAVAQRESSLNPNAVSSEGAQGVMQLMPATAAQFGVTNRFRSRPEHHRRRAVSSTAPEYVQRRCGERARGLQLGTSQRQERAVAVWRELAVRRARFDAGVRLRDRGRLAGAAARADRDDDHGGTRKKRPRRSRPRSRWTPRRGSL